MITSDKHFYDKGPILAEFVAMPYRVIDGEADDYSDDIAVCNTCNKQLDKDLDGFIGHTLIDCFHEIYRKLKEYE